MPGVGQPDGLPEHKFRVDGTICFESPVAIGPTNILPAGSDFNLRTEVGFDGTLDGMLTGQTFNVFHHVQNLENGTTTTLPLAGGTFVVPGAAGARAHITVTSGPYTTADTPGPADLVIPAGFDAGTFRVLTHIHAVDTAVKPLVAGFHDGLIIMVTKP